MASFRKTDRLTDKKAIDLLFKREGYSKNYFPILVLKCPFTFEKGAAVQLLISVPKRRLKNAVDRNLVKRRIRAAYQEMKTEIENATQAPTALGFVYLANTPLPFEQIRKSIQKFRDEHLSETK